MSSCLARSDGARGTLRERLVVAGVSLLALACASACAPRALHRDVVPPGEDAGEGGEDGGQGGRGGGGGAAGTGGLGGGGAGGASERDAAGGGAGGTSLPDAAAPDAPAPQDLGSADLATADAGIDVARDLPAAADSRDGAMPDTPPGVNLNAGLVHHWKFDEGMTLLTADSSGRGNTGMLIGVPNWMPGGAPIPNTANPFSLMFDGTDDYVDLTTSLTPVLGGTASLSCWIKTMMTGNDNSPDAPGITGAEESGGSDDIFWGYMDATGRIGVRPGGGNAAKSMAPVNNNMWRHIVMTRDRVTGTIQMFVDGKLATTTVTSTGDKAQAFKAIGRITNSSKPYFRGQIDDVRIWDRVLSAAEVSVLFSGVPAPP